MNTITNVASGHSAATGTSRNSVSLQDLQRQYPGLKLSAQSFGSEAALRDYAFKQSGKYNVAIDPRALSRMGEDAELFGKVHDILATVKEGDDLLERLVNANGAELVACGTVIDKDGNGSGWVISRTSSEGAGIFASSDKHRQDLAERLEEKRREKLEAKRLEEKKAAEEALEVKVSVEVEETKFSHRDQPAPSGLDMVV